MCIQRKSQIHEHIGLPMTMVVMSLLRTRLTRVEMLERDLNICIRQIKTLYIRSVNSGILLLQPVGVEAHHSCHETDVINGFEGGCEDN